MENTISKKLETAINNCSLPSYIYGYPSKRTYRKFENPFSLHEIWDSQKGSLNLYVHIPFCNYKCAYCTLLSAKVKDSAMQASYIAALMNEIKEYGKIAGHMKVDSIYFGGGTPTLLTNDQLEFLIFEIYRSFPNVAVDAEIAIEGSPETMDLEKLEFLKRLGVNRISMGVQTFRELELSSTGRPYSIDTVIKAVSNIKSVNFKNFNMDLIYGLEYQTKDSWLYSLEKTIHYHPDSINLYPVVIRPLSGIEKSRQENQDRFMEDDLKYELYDISTEYLRDHGYHQESFVSFTNLKDDGYKQQVNDFGGNPLIGIGVGARSYTDSIHYSTDYVVTHRSTMNMISDYITGGFQKMIQYGYVLDVNDQKIRYVILNLLINKLNSNCYGDKFQSDMRKDFVLEFEALSEQGCVIIDEETGNVTLTDKGFKYSSIIGSLFESDKVKNLVNTFIDK